MKNNYIALRKAERVILRDESPKAVHDMRLAGRRLRAALKLFKDILPNGIEQLGRFLAEVGEKLGITRDLDAHIAYLNAEHRLPSLNNYLSFLKAERDRARNSALRAIQSPCLKKLAEDINGILKNIPACHKAPTDAREILKKCKRRMMKASKIARNNPCDRTLHDLRRAVRRFRYSSQFFKSTGSNKIKKLISLLEKRQDQLGERQDRLAGLRLASRYLARKEITSTGSERTAMRDLILKMTAEKNDLQKQILKSWRKPGRRKIRRLAKKSLDVIPA